MADLLKTDKVAAPYRADVMVKAKPLGDQNNGSSLKVKAHLKGVVYATVAQLRNEEISWRNAATNLEKAGVPLEVICTTLLPYSGKVINNDMDRRRNPNQRELVDFIVSLLDNEGLSWSSAAVLLDNAGISVATICRVLSSDHPK